MNIIRMSNIFDILNIYGIIYLDMQEAVSSHGGTPQNSLLHFYLNKSSREIWSSI